ncbi:death-on-curing protein [Crossiella equi]|uniref:Death-on-curing protein n=1 Tax=Crossiella equi TaxID=130796 RepID=A0ABS5AHA0_9PSEU|nr:Fic family protein [Crossiella equi]MBP2475954.1 death-on-curing protein [Crossiella equi]
MPDWTYLTPEQVITLAEQHGASPVRDLGQLEAALGAPAASAFGQDMHIEVAGKAAALMHSVVKVHHPFIDGNKRAGAASMLAFCYLNGFVPKISPSELVAITMLLAGGELDRDQLTEFLRTRMI